MELWGVNRHPLNRRVALIEELIRKENLPVTVEQVREHTANHRAPQPSPRAEVVARELEDAWRWLVRKPRRLPILEFVAQGKMVSAEQVAAFFWPNSTTAVRQARKTLRAMAYRHLVYRVHLDGWHRPDPSEIYGLGRVGAEILSAEGPIGSWRWVGSPAGMDTSKAAHDLGVGDLVVSFYRSCGQTQVAGRRLRTSLLLENYWAHQMWVQTPIPAHVNEVGKMVPAGTVGVRPDGFLTIGVEMLDPSPNLAQSFLLPLLLEEDRGRRSLDDAKEQIFNNFNVALSGAMGRRFPELGQIEGLIIPLLFVTRSRLYSGRRRAFTIKKSVEQLWRERGFDRKFPIGDRFALPHGFIALDRDVREKGLMARAVPIFSDTADFEQAPTILEALISSCGPLARSGAIPADHRLTIDVDTYPWDGGRLTQQKWRRKAGKKAEAGEAQPIPESKLAPSKKEKEAAKAEWEKRLAATREYEEQMARLRQEGGES